MIITIRLLNCNRMICIFSTCADNWLTIFQTSWCQRNQFLAHGWVCFGNSAVDGMDTTHFVSLIVFVMLISLIYRHSWLWAQNKGTVQTNTAINVASSLNGKEQKQIHQISIEQWNLKKLMLDMSMNDGILIKNSSFFKWFQWFFPVTPRFNYNLTLYRFLWFGIPTSSNRWTKQALNHLVKLSCSETSAPSQKIIGFNRNVSVAFVCLLMLRICRIQQIVGWFGHLTIEMSIGSICRLRSVT